MMAIVIHSKGLIHVFIRRDVYFILFGKFVHSSFLLLELGLNVGQVWHGLLSGCRVRVL